MASRADRTLLITTESLETDSNDVGVINSESGGGDRGDHAATSDLGINTSRFSSPVGSIQIDAEGEVYTITRGGSVHLNSDRELECSTPWHFASTESMQDFSSAPSMEEYAQFIGLGEEEYL